MAFYISAINRTGAKYFASATFPHFKPIDGRASCGVFLTHRQRGEPKRRKQMITAQEIADTYGASVGQVLARARLTSHEIARIQETRDMFGMPKVSDEEAVLLSLIVEFRDAKFYRETRSKELANGESK
jgi:predicted ATPase